MSVLSLSTDVDCSKLKLHKNKLQQITEIEIGAKNTDYLQLLRLCAAADTQTGQLDWLSVLIQFVVDQCPTRDTGGSNQWPSD